MNWQQLSWEISHIGSAPSVKLSQHHCILSQLGQRRKRLMSKSCSPVASEWRRGWLDSLSLPECQHWSFFIQTDLNVFKMALRLFLNIPSRCFYSHVHYWIAIKTSHSFLSSILHDFHLCCVWAFLQFRLLIFALITNLPLTILCLER